MQTRDRLIPWYFVVFFIFLTIVYSTMATIAIRTQSGVVSKHPYEQGLAYNEIVNASQKQAALGWSSNIEFTQEKPNSGRLSFILKDKSGKILKPENVTAKITRPTQAGMDFEENLTPTNSGEFAAEIKFPLSGLWEIRIFTKGNIDSYQQSKRIVIE